MRSQTTKTMMPHMMEQQQWEDARLQAHMELARGGVEGIGHLFGEDGEHEPACPECVAAPCLIILGNRPSWNTVMIGVVGSDWLCIPPVLPPPCHLLPSTLATHRCCAACATDKHLPPAAAIVQGGFLSP